MTTSSDDLPVQSSAPISRRELVTSALAAGSLWAASSAFPTPVSAQDAGSIKAKSVILFQGDSITDAGRNRRHAGPNNAGAFGRGYPQFIAGWLLATRPKDGLQLYNRGISGHRVPDLDKRWLKDTIDLKPNVLSILIGVNDIWHKLNGKYAGTVADYESGFAALLGRTKESLPNVRLVVCEPFVLRCGAVTDKWFPEFDERRAAAKRVAETAGATWVPFQTMFDEATRDAPAAYWAGDGVHPSMAGHALMAKTWLETVRP